MPLDMVMSSYAWRPRVMFFDCGNKKGSGEAGSFLFHAWATVLHVPGSLNISGTSALAAAGLCLPEVDVAYVYVFLGDIHRT